MDFVLGTGPVQPDVGQQPVLRVRMTVEGQVKLVADPAVRAVAAGHVAGGDHARLTARVPDPRGDSGRLVGEAGQLGALLDHAA